jgi:hypothetical protein
MFRTPVNSTRREVTRMPSNPEKGPNNPSRQPETRPGLAKPRPDLTQAIGQTAVKGSQKDKGKK